MSNEGEEGGDSRERGKKPKIITFSRHLTSIFFPLLVITFFVCLFHNIFKRFFKKLPVPQLLFCGYFVRITDLPKVLGWLQWIMPLTYSFRLAVMEELISANCVDDTAESNVCATFLNDMNATEDYEQQYWLTLVGMIILIRCFAVFSLHGKLSNLPSILSTSSSLHNRKKNQQQQQQQSQEKK